MEGGFITIFVENNVLSAPTKSQMALFREKLETLNQWLQVVTTGSDDVTDYRVVVISFDLVSKKEFDLRSCQFRVAIIDESHTLKNYKSQRCKSVTAVLNEACQHAVLLSGTPALSRPIELYTQICLVDDKLFPFVTDFGMRYCDGKKVNYGGAKVTF